MDLEDAARDAREKMKAIEQELQESEGIYAELDQRINEATQRINADWARVAAAAKALVEELHTRKAELDTERADVHEAHGHLTQEIDTAHNDSHDATEHARTELDSLKEHATTLEGQHRQHLADASQKGQEAKEQADQVEQGLSALIQSVGQFLGDETGQQLENLGKEVEEAGHQWETFITDQIVPQIDSQAQETQTKFEGFHSDFQEHGHNLEEQAKTQSTESAQKCKQDHDDTLNTLEEAADEVKKILEQLGSFLGKGIEIIEEGKGALKTGVDTTNVGVNAAIGILEDLKSFFERFSFI